MSNHVDMVCGTCGIEYCMPERINAERLKDHKLFYCPNGHGRYYPGKSDLEIDNERIESLEKRANRLQARVFQLQELLTWTEKSRNAYMGHFNRLKKETT